MLIEETPSELAEDEATLLIPVHDLPACRLYVGNLPGACDGAALLAAGITSSLNVSLNIDAPPLQLPDGTHMRRSKVGLIDGAGNAPSHLAAAVLALDGLVRQASPGKPHYPAHRAGNVLVNCRGGRSRSVTVLALYLHLKAPDAYPTFPAAVAHVRGLRGSSETYPLPPMIALAETLLQDDALRRLVN